MKVNAWCKENETYYSVITGMMKRGVFPKDCYIIDEAGKYEITDPEKAAEWYQSYKASGTARRKRGTTVVTDENGMNHKPVREGDFVKRTSKIGKSKKKRVIIEKVIGVDEFLIQTDDGLDTMPQPWTHQGFNEGHVITTPKAIIKLLIKEYECRERPDVVHKLEETLLIMDQIYDEPVIGTDDYVDQYEEDDEDDIQGITS